MNDTERILKFIEDNVGLELDDWQKSYVESFWHGYMPGARLSMRFYRKLGYKYIWETDSTLMFLDTLREGSGAHLALRETLHYRTKVTT